MKLEGVVTNVTRFGAFVDIGAEQDGLLHISELSDKLDKESKPAVKAGDRITTHILALQEKRQANLPVDKRASPPHSQATDSRSPAPDKRRET